MFILRNWPPKGGGRYFLMSKKNYLKGKIFDLKGERKK